MLGDKPMPSGKHRNGKIWKKTLIKGVFVIFVSHVSLFCSLWQYVTMLFAELPSKSSNRSPKTTRSALHLQHTLLSEPSLEGACRGLATTAFQAFHGYSMAIPWLLSAQQLDPDPIPVRSQQLQKATQPTHIRIHYVTLHAKPRNLQTFKACSDCSGSSLLVRSCLTCHN